MNVEADRNWTKVLFNPSVYWAGGKALGLGALFMFAAGLVAAVAHTHFDGVLDMHAGGPGTFLLFLGEGFVDWVCLATCLYLAGKMISRSAFRGIDVFGTQALARAPSLGTAALALPPAFGRYTGELIAQLKTHPQSLPPLNTDSVYFFSATIVMLLLLAWMVTLMFNAYRVACNVRGARAVISFTVALLVAEIVSKCAIEALDR